MKIRDATQRDLPGIVEIERLAFDNPWSLDAFERELSLPFSRLIVAIQASTQTAARGGSQRSGPEQTYSLDNRRSGRNLQRFHN
jgi:hypothetical protein